METPRLIGIPNIKSRRVWSAQTLRSLLAVRFAV